MRVVQVTGVACAKLAGKELRLWVTVRPVWLEHGEKEESAKQCGQSGRQWLQQADRLIEHSKGLRFGPNNCVNYWVAVRWQKQWFLSCAYLALEWVWSFSHKPVVICPWIFQASSKTRISFIQPFIQWTFIKRLQFRMNIWFWDKMNEWGWAKQSNRSWRDTNRGLFSLICSPSSRGGRHEKETPLLAQRYMDNEF